MEKGWGRGSDLNDGHAHAHAEDDAQVLLQPRLHLLHAALQGENTVTPPPCTIPPHHAEPPRAPQSQPGRVLPVPLNEYINKEVDEGTNDR